MNSVLRRISSFSAFYSQRLQCGVIHLRKQSTWDIVAATVVCRPSVIVRSMNILERSYYDQLLISEAESSLFSDFELEWMKEEEQLKKLKEGNKEAVLVDLLRDRVELWKKELETFQKEHPPAQPAVEDVKSLERCLSEPLYLITQQTVSDSSFWIFPQTKWNEGETLKETAQKAINDLCGGSDQCGISVIGNAPVALYKYKYPQNARNDNNAQGAKIFFYKARLLDKKDTEVEKTLRETKQCKDFMWATYTELKSRLHKKYSEAVLPSVYYIPPVDFTRLLDSVEQQMDSKRTLDSEQVKNVRSRKSN